MSRWIAPLLLTLTAPVFGQGIITSYAGSNAIFFDTGHPPNQASVIYPAGVAVDTQGNVYISSAGLNTVLKVTPSSVITVYAGNGLRRSGGDGGPAISASLNLPQGLALDSSGNLYICDAGNARVRRVAVDGTITTIAGTGVAGFSGDNGRATQAQFRSPSGVAVDPAGNIYVSDRLNERIRKIDTSGIVTTIAGTGASAGGRDNVPALQATFAEPFGLALDAAGNLYIADTNNSTVRKLGVNGIITTVVGTGAAGFQGDGAAATQARLWQPTSVAFDASGNLYIADSLNHRIRRVSAAGVITTVAGNGNAAFSGDAGPASGAAFSLPSAVAVGANGNIYVADRNNGRLRRFLDGGNITTIAGTGIAIGDNGPAASAILNRPQSIAVDAADNLYIADTNQNRIRKVTPAGLISTVAGNGQTGFSGDNGPATQAVLNQPIGIAVDGPGNLYIADASNNVVRKVTPDGRIAAFAGNGTCCNIVDGGPAISTAVFFPQHVVVDSTGVVYFSNMARAATGESQGLVVRRVSLDGIVRTVAGNLKPGFSGDGGPATQASLGATQINLAIDANDNLLIADVDNHRVRKVDADGTITTIAGNGSSTASGDGGPAVSAGVPTPLAVVTDSSGNLYISSGTTVIRKVAPDGTISTYAGSGIFGSFGDGGPALAAAMATPVGLAIDSAGNVYSSELGNDRVRQIRPGQGPIAVISQQGVTFSIVSGTAAPPARTVSVINAGRGTLNWSAAASVSSGPIWLAVSQATGVSAPGSAGSFNVSVSPAGLAAGTYFGTVVITAPGSPNSPQSLTVVLSVLPAGQSTSVSVQPAGLLFTGGDPQSITLTAAAADRYSATLDFGGGPNWFSVTPASGNLAAGTGATITVQPVAGLDPGVYRGSINLTFANGSAQVQVAMTIAAAAQATARPRARPKAAGCAPQQLLAVVVSPAAGAGVPAGLPTPLEVRVADDCGQPLTDGAVVASFSNGDAPVTLQSLQDGNWAGTWLPQSGGDAGVNVTATSADGQYTGNASVAISLRANTGAQTSVQRGGVVNGASLSPGAPLAPGTMVTILGSQLAAGSVTAQGTPLPTTLGGTSVSVSGQRLPLLSVASDRISAILPLDLAINATHQLIVTGTAGISLPEPISVISSAPAVFTQDGSGSGSAVVALLAADGSQPLLGPSNPISTGQTLVITCAGMGSVNPLAVTGSPPPASPVSNVVDTPVVTIGGLPAQIRFAALTPGRLGIYQIGAIVPAGVAAGDSVPVVVTQPGGAIRLGIPVK